MLLLFRENSEGRNIFGSTSAMPSDVRKVSDLPRRLSLIPGLRPIPCGKPPERQSLSAHQAAKPQIPSERCEAPDIFWERLRSEDLFVLGYAV
jgi:hypothetical protein